MKLLITCIVLVLVIGGFFVFRQSTNAPTVSEMALTSMDVSTNNADANNINVSTSTSETSVSSSSTSKTFVVVGSNFAFNPKTLTVNKGDKVTIVFKNSGGFHDLKIDEFNVATKKINGGQDDTIEFVADKAGTFQYYCSIGEHRAMGMWGTLTVK